MEEKICRLITGEKRHISTRLYNHFVELRPRNITVAPFTNDAPLTKLAMCCWRDESFVMYDVNQFVSKKKKKTRFQQKIHTKNQVWHSEGTTWRETT